MNVRVTVYDTRDVPIRRREGAAPVTIDLTGLRGVASVLIDVLPGEMDGPYDGEANGRDIYGHAVNSYGRCAGMNERPEPTCPPEVGQ